MVEREVFINATHASYKMILNVRMTRLAAFWRDELKVDVLVVHICFQHCKTLIIKSL